MRLPPPVLEAPARRLPHRVRRAQPWPAACRSGARSSMEGAVPQGAERIAAFSSNPAMALLTIAFLGLRRLARPSLPASAAAAQPSRAPCPPRRRGRWRRCRRRSSSRRLASTWLLAARSRARRGAGNFRLALAGDASCSRSAALLVAHGSRTDETARRLHPVFLRASSAVLAAVVQYSSSASACMPPLRGAPTHRPRRAPAPAFRGVANRGVGEPVGARRSRTWAVVAAHPVPATHCVGAPPPHRAKPPEIGRSYDGASCPRCASRGASSRASQDDPSPLDRRIAELA
jgi:hypothetical protein